MSYLGCPLLIGRQSPIVASDWWPDRLASSLLVDMPRNCLWFDDTNCQISCQIWQYDLAAKLWYFTQDRRSQIFLNQDSSCPGSWENWTPLNRSKLEYSRKTRLIVCQLGRYERSRYRQNKECWFFHWLLPRSSIFKLFWNQGRQEKGVG